MQFFAPRNTYAQGQTPYDIFKDRMSAITSIMGEVKNLISRRYHKGLFETYLTSVNKKITEDQGTKIMDLFNKELEIDSKNLEATVSQFVDNEMGLMAKKEKMMQMGTLSIAPTKPKTELMIPKNDKMEFLNAIQSLPSNQMDWTNITNYMKEHRPSMMGSSSPMEQGIMNQMLGQPSARDKLMQDIKTAETVRNYFAEPEPEKPTAKMQEAQMWIEKFNKKEINRDELMKLLGGYVAPEKLSDWEKKWNKFVEIHEENDIPISLDNALKILGSYVDKPDWEGKFEEFMKTDPTDNEIKEFFKGRIKPTTPKGLKDLTGSAINTYNKMFYGGDDDWGAITPEQYAEAVDNLEKMNIGKTAPEHIDILEKALQYCLNPDNTIITRGEKNKQTDEWFEYYEWIYPYYKDALKGQSPKYLPPEEIKKVGAIEGALTGGGVRRGDYGSALVTDKQGKEKDDKGYIVGQTYEDEEGTLCKYLGIVDGEPKFEKVEEEKTERRRR